MLPLTTIARLVRRLPERRRFSIRVRRFASVRRRENSLLVQRAMLFRLLHGYENGESAMVGSWRTYCYDHIFASQALSAQSIVPLYTLKAHQLSDLCPLKPFLLPKQVLKKTKLSAGTSENLTRSQIGWHQLFNKRNKNEPVKIWQRRRICFQSAG